MPSQVPCLSQQVASFGHLGTSLYAAMLPTRWVAHLEQLLANTLALAALMHVEVKHRQWLRLDKRCSVLQQRTAQGGSQVVKLGT